MIKSNDVTLKNRHVSKRKSPWKQNKTKLFSFCRLRSFVSKVIIGGIFEPNISVSENEQGTQKKIHFQRKQSFLCVYSCAIQQNEHPKHAYRIFWVCFRHEWWPRKREKREQRKWAEKKLSTDVLFSLGRLMAVYFSLAFFSSSFFLHFRYSFILF